MSEVPSTWALIREDLRTQREGLLSQGFWALFVHRLAHRRMRARRGVGRKVWALVNHLAIKHIEIWCGISIAEGARIGRRLRIEHFGGIIIHGAAVIGDDCLLRQGVTIGNASDADPAAAPVIGDRVTIGAGAKILGRITVGAGAVIGANAVVIRDVPEGAVAVGVPARIVPASASVITTAP